MPLPAESGGVAADCAGREQRLDAARLISRARFGARLGRLAAGLLAVALAVFALSAWQRGGSERAYLGPYALDPAARAELRRDLHLDSSPPIRFVRFVADAARGDLGRSPVSGVDIGTVVGERLLESMAFAAAAVGVALLATWPRRRAARTRPATREPGGEPVGSAIPGALWAVPLLIAVAVAWGFGAIPTAGAHSAIASRCAASLLPALALGLALAGWAATRRAARDLVAAVLVGTLVTEVVFDLPGLGSLLATAATRPDPLLMRGAVLATAAVAVVACVAFIPVGAVVVELTGAMSPVRRAANGTIATLWVVVLVAATIGRSNFRLAPAGRVTTNVGAAITGTHPFGTDVLGRDELARVLATARGSLLLVVAAMLVATVLGTVIGVFVAFLGGRLERAGVAALAGWAAFPSEIVAVALLAFNGRDGNRATIALAFVAAPSIAFGARRRTVDALHRADPRLRSGAWLRNVAARAAPGLLPAALATLFVGASRVVVAEIVAAFLGVGPAATQTWSHEIVMQFASAAHAPLAVVAPALVALFTAVALAGLGNAIRPVAGRGSRSRGSAAGHAEDALRQDVLVDLRGAPGDRERT